MMRALALAATRRFSRRYAYPVPHLEALIGHSTGAFLRYTMVSSLAGRQDRIGAAASHAARITAVREAGCAACLDLSERLAIEAGISPAEVTALSRGACEPIGEDAALAARFARAMAGSDPELTALRDAVTSRWGAAGLLELALAVEFSRIHTSLKRALGTTGSCAVPNGAIA